MRLLTQVATANQEHKLTFQNEATRSFITWHGQWSIKINIFNTSFSISCRFKVATLLRANIPFLHKSCNRRAQRPFGYPWIPILSTCLRGEIPSPDNGITYGTSGVGHIHPLPFTLRKVPSIHILSQVESTPWPLYWWMDLVNWRAMSSYGLEPLTFWFEAQCCNQLYHPVFHDSQTK